MPTSTTNWNNAFGTTGTPTVSKFEIGDEVFKESELLQEPGDNLDFPHNKYCVVYIVLKLQSTQVLDLAGSDASPDLGGPNSPFWYILQNQESGETDAVATHEDDTKTLAEAKAIVKTEVDDWT